MPKSKFNKRLFIVNFFGTLFYMSCLLQWTWAILPYLPSINRLIDSLQLNSTAQPVERITMDSPPLIMLVTVIIITIIVLVITTYLLIKLPVSIGKTAAKLTKKTSLQIVPIVTNNSKISPTKRRILTARIVRYIKLTVCILPVIITSFAFFITDGLSYDLTIFIASIIAINSIILLCLQLLFAKFLHVNDDKIW